MCRRQPEGVIPHQPPFRFAEGGPSLLATAGAAESFPQPLTATILAEAMAQAILLADPPPPGVNLRLAGLDGLVVRQQVHAGEKLWVKVEKEASFGTLARYYCRVVSAGRLVACGRITVGF